MNYQLDFTTPPEHLHRHNAPETSVMAANDLNVAQMEKIVLDCIATFKDGCIADDLIKAMPQYSYSSITARPSSLFKKGLICYTGEKRKGRSGKMQRVVKINEH